jgi:hypothetical protein
MNITEHLEKYLGHISHGWKETGNADGVQIACFKNSPEITVDTFSTIGLSRYELTISDKKDVRQELIFPVSGKYSFETISSCLLFICDLILEDHTAILRGQVIKFPKEGAKKLGFDAIYCAIPVFMEDSFATFSDSNPPTVIVWLMPIYKDEADFIESNGWEKFEDVLGRKNPDLFVLGRNTVIERSQKSRRKS